jgi:DNA polymerase-3 subunit chi
VLLSEIPEAGNTASHVIFADGQFRTVDGFARAFLLFDDNNLQQARETWKSLDGEASERAFFRQDGGKWVKVA